MVGTGSRDFKRLRCSSTSTKEEEDAISLDSVPSHLVEEILVRIPAQDILESMRCVCRMWYQMTLSKSFKVANLQHSTPGLVIKNMFNGITYFMYLTKAGQIAISRINYKFVHSVWSSCNGLILDLVHSDRKHNSLIITNPVTNQQFPLPPFIPLTQPHSSSAIAYVATRTEYKVVRMYYLGLGEKKFSHNACAILTVGVDKSWRLVDTQHLSLEACELFDKPPLVTGGFVHWANDDWDTNGCIRFNKKNQITTRKCSTYVLTLNMETEMISLYPAPQCKGRYYYKYLNSGGGNLSLFIGLGYLKWDVWEMKPETGEWTKLPGIDLGAHKDLLDQLYDTQEREEARFKLVVGDPLDIKLTPGGWLKYREVIIFIVHRPVMTNRFLQARLRVVYNLQTQDITVFTLDYNFSDYLVHCNSLIGF